ncbi:hypothetical protein QP905_02370 [Corynebacterium pseudodiphtheriticum]|uniref:hypothetical protein n=1 Tax=Corynebacterium pseudodiphtheriticum TaxID=37637 RepID=UPI00254B3E37|nr:hypothetical protein [Corynebacterium pseudodiphtheriticum]MDK8577188.1 hypothetical protein [Corynebacterium pseudodiphtheriticum]
MQKTWEILDSGKPALEVIDTFSGSYVIKSLRGNDCGQVLLQLGKLPGNYFDASDIEKIGRRMLGDAQITVVEK